ncbi:MAG: TIM-barrel domain-containing protein [Tetrasphaera sp.]
MHWRNEWANAEQALEDARRIRAEHIPVSTLWIDNPWEDSYNSHAFDTRRFPDPPALLRELARMGYQGALVEHAVPRRGGARRDARQHRRAAVRAGARPCTGSCTLSDGSPFVSPANPGSAGGMGDSRGALVDFSSTPARNFWTSRVAAPRRDGRARGSSWTTAKT